MKEELTDNIYFLVLDSGGPRQIQVACHSHHNFETWQAEVRHDLQIDGVYQATVVTPDGPRTTLVSMRGPCTITFMRRSDVEKAMALHAQHQRNIVVPT